MKKKIITTTILALGLLQGASTAYAEDFTQRIGGVGYGHIFSLQPNGVPSPVDVPIGNMVIKLNGELSNDTNDYIGDAFLTATILNENPITQQLTFSCTANAVGDTGHQIAVNNCTYAPILDGINLTSDGECYITHDDHHRVMACNFMYSFFEIEEGEMVAVAPVAFSTMF